MSSVHSDAEWLFPNTDAWDTAQAISFTNAWRPHKEKATDQLLSFFSNTFCADTNILNKDYI